MGLKRDFFFSVVTAGERTHGTVSTAHWKQTPAINSLTATENSDKCTGKLGADIIDNVVKHSEKKINDCSGNTNTGSS